jgi:shikimate dehydrogenase
VNTVSFQDGKSIGYNTDLEGAHTALKPHASSLRSGTALILGVGGAARAVASALDREFGMSRITFASRSNERGGRFLNSCARLATPNAILEKIPYDPALIGRCLDRAVLLVNATPVGTRGFSSASPLPRGVTLNSHLVVFDLVYRPRRTRLLTQAEAAGCRTIGGWGMLLAQAEESFRIWTGRGFPVSSIRTLAGMT